MFEDEKDQPLTVAQIKKFQNTDFSVVESKFKILPITGNTDLFKSLGDGVSINGTWFKLRKEWLFVYTGESIPNSKTNSFSFSVKKVK